MAPAPRQKPKPGQSSLLSFFAPKAPAQSAPASSSNNGNPNNNTNADKKKIDHGKQPSTHHEHVAESLAIRDAKPDHADRPQGVGEKRSEELLESDNEDEEEAGPAVSRSVCSWQENRVAWNTDDHFRAALPSVSATFILTRMRRTMCTRRKHPLLLVTCFSLYLEKWVAYTLILG